MSKEVHLDIKVSPIMDLRIPGLDTEVEVVQAFNNTEREWLAGQPVCALLSQHGILHTGVMHAQFPFEVTREDQSGTFMLSCFEGEGLVLVDGEWVTVRAGEACLQPPFVANALKCVAGKTWSFSWVRYIESREVTPIVTEVSPVSGDYQAEPLRAAIRGLIAESKGLAVAASQHHWVELIHHYVLRFAQPHQEDERLWKLWREVEGDVKYNWTLTVMAQKSCMSEEHLRRLCKKQLGRSPVQHLTFLRVQAACKLLSVTDDKVEVVAKSVGYANGANFSNAFTRWVGVGPAEYRAGRK